MSHLIPSLRNSVTSYFHKPQPIKQAAPSKSIRDICNIAYLIIICVLVVVVLVGAMLCMFIPSVGIPLCLSSLALLVLLSIFNPCLINWISTKKTKEIAPKDASESQPTKSASRKGSPQLSPHHDHEPKNFIRTQLEKGVNYVTNKFKSGEESPHISDEHHSPRQSKRSSEIESSDESSPELHRKAKGKAPHTATTKESKTSTTESSKKKKKTKHSLHRTTSSIHKRSAPKPMVPSKKRKPVPLKKPVPLPIEDLEHQSSGNESSDSSSPPPVQRKAILPWFCKQPTDP
ncbi:hypothetical protein CPK_ORF00527 [Chlamydia pneumoniae LPCoLN]|uniref:hypothetical protein n=1 Tax=Chlamydia pneumoniae TaxID=83558 RepID=UPI0001BD9E47|nr:hypothetical protein [Chlamydia pneumoniae]ACZ32998.1 hypothetical protein CPK_ORF00527 [Chlamydia pneumoniae LPCoLN]ETR79899.1 hypothetical protein X556_0777 [Chlamydia pneumoniae B21]